MCLCMCALEFGNHYGLFAVFVFHLAYYSVVIAIASIGNKCFVCGSVHFVTVLYLAVARHDFVFLAEFHVGLRMLGRCSFAILQFVYFDVSCTRSLLVAQMAGYFVPATEKIKSKANREKAKLIFKVM